MKKIISLLLSVMICLTCMISAIPVTAASDQVDAEITKGGDFSIDVVIPESVMAKAGSIEFVYSDDFEFISGDWTLQNTTMKRYTSSTNKGVFTFESDQSVVGTVFVINLKTSDNIELGEHCINYSVSLRNADGISQIFDGDYLLDVVESSIIGDTNLDGSINIRDVTAIQRHIAELEVFTNEQIALADTNGDGEINIADATHLQMYLAEYDVVLGKA